MASFSKQGPQSGFYAGANFGAGWSNGCLNIPGNNLYGGLTEFIGGVQAGYNFEVGHLLFGVEGDLDWASSGLCRSAVGSVEFSEWMINQ